MRLELEFLVEEQSMKLFLEGLLPKVLPDPFYLYENTFIRPHQGKQDLQRSIPIKAKALSNKNSSVLIVVIHDQDSNNCKLLKKDLVTLCKKGTCPYLVCIACRELEAWYIGDVDALGKIYLNFKPKKYRDKKLFKNPDNCQASEELKKVIPDFKKGYAAQHIASQMTISQNTSASFKHFISGLEKFLQNELKKRSMLNTIFYP